MKQTLSYLFVAGLLMLACVRPWHQAIRALGLTTPMDSLRADSCGTTPPDSLLVERVAVTLPDIISDSLSYSVKARTKKKAYLEEQNRWLQAENQKLEARYKQLQRENQQRGQALLGQEEIDKLLSKQAGKGTHGGDTEVSDLEKELNQRSRPPAKPFGKNDP